MDQIDRKGRHSLQRLRQPTIKAEVCQHPHQPVTLRFPYPEYDTKSINKNSKNSQSGPKSRQTTEPEDKKLIKLIPNEIINAHLRKKLDTEPIESIKVNFRLSTSQSKKKYQRVLNTKRDIEEEGEREKEREKQRDKDKEKGSICQKCANYSELQRENNFLKCQVKTMMSATNLWQNSKATLQEVMRMLQITTEETGSGEILPRVDRSRLMSEVESMTMELKKKVFEMMNQIELYSCLQEGDLLSLDYLRIQANNDNVDKLDQYAEVKTWIDSLREQFMGEINYSHSKQYNLEPIGTMLRCKLKRTEEKLKHYVKENILLKTKKELHYFSSVYDEEIRKIVEEVLRRYHSNHNPKPKRSLQPKMLMV